MSLNCIKCKNLALGRDKYPCNSCRELDYINRMFSHFVNRNYKNRRYEEWKQILKKNRGE